MIETDFLANHPGVIPTLAAWFRAQWPAHYGQRTLADIERDFHAEADRRRLPVRLLAFVDGELAGTIVLRDHAMQILPEFRPGLGGLFVPTRLRARGVGTELVRAGMDVARRQGYGAVYAVTAAAGGILTRLGWTAVQEVVEQDDERLILYRCVLDARDAARHASRADRA